jgi:hypothetical protein
MHPEQIASIVFVVILIVWAAEHIAVSALHAAARIRDTKRQLFPPKKPMTIGPRIVENSATENENENEDRKAATR